MVEENKFKLTIQGCDLTIDLPEETFYVEGIQIAKRGIAMDIQKFLPELAETRFIETFKAEPKPVPVTTAPAAPASTEPEPVTEAKPTEEEKPQTEVKPTKTPKAAKTAKP